AALLERLPAALEVSEVRLLELEAALRLHELAAGLVQMLLPRPERLLGLRQALVFGFEPLAGLFDLLLRAAGARGPHVQRLGELRALLAPLRELGAPLGVLALESVARLLEVAQLRLVLGDERVCRVQGGLGEVERVAGGVVRAARGLDPRLDAAELRVLGLERVGGLVDVLGLALALGGGVAPAQVPEEMLLELQ